MKIIKMKTLKMKQKIKKSKKLNLFMKHLWMYQVYFQIQYSKDKIKKNKNQDFLMISMMKVIKNKHQLKLTR